MPPCVASGGSNGISFSEAAPGPPPKRVRVNTVHSVHRTRKIYSIISPSSP